MFAALGAAQEPDQQSAPEAVQEPVPAQQSPLEPAAASAVTTLQGVVRNATTGQPLPRALVRIEGDADTGTLTDGEGRFQIPGVPVGPQTIQVRKPGFLDRPYATEEVGYQADGPAHSVLVAAGMADLEFALTPASAIHGRVELSTGDPADGIAITLLKQVAHNGRAVWAQEVTTRTNGDGAYRFAGLPEGVYAVATQPALESEPAETMVAAGSAASVARGGFPGVFYPEARELSAAGHIRLASGDQAEANLLLALEPFYTVAATVFLPNGRAFGGNDPGGGASNSSLQAITVLDGSGHRLAYNAQFDSSTHSVQASLPDGVYTLLVVTSPIRDSFIEHFASRRSPDGNAPRQPQNAGSFVGSVEFSVDGHSPANLRIPLAPMPSWPIRLRTVRTGAQAATGARQGRRTVVSVQVTDAGESGTDSSGGTQTADEAGPDLLELSGAGPGTYWVNTLVDDGSVCVTSFTAGGINLAREPLNLAMGATPPPMELTLRDDCAKLTLQLPQALAAFVPGEEPFYTVYVVPDFDTTADVPPMTMHPSSGGALTIDGLTPGGYHVYVFDRPVRLEYRNPAVLAALPSPGQAVTLSPGATGSLVLEAPGR